MVIIDTRENKNHYWDGKYYMSVSDDDENDIVVGTWSGILHSGQGDRHIREITVDEFIEFVNSFNKEVN